MKIIIGADHAGFALKERLVPWLESLGHIVSDIGAHELVDGDDYPDYVRPLVAELLKDDKARGIFCAGSGEGEAIAANRHKGIRAAVYNAHDLEVAKRVRTDNNANLLCIGSRFVGEGDARDAIEVFLSTKFDSQSRHARRLAKIDAK